MHHPGTHSSDSPTDAQGSQGGFLQQFGRSEESSEFFTSIPDGYRPGRHAYVAVFGTVMSGLGKGIFASSLAKLFKDKGLTVAPIKLEGYLNIDAGTLNPYRHGEVFVLDDGTECDMDLGTYERMLDQPLSRQNFATSGQIYSTILERERRGEYLGRDVQMIPHVTGEVKRRLRHLAMTGGPGGGEADLVFVEVGGTVGDYENGFYIEALRELAFEEGPNSTCFVALTYVLEPQILGEQKSKAAQLGIKRLMAAGVQPHIIACRAKNEVSMTVQQKISMFSNVPMGRVFSMHDRESIYTIPEAMRAESLDREVLSILDKHDCVAPVAEDKARAAWNTYAQRIAAKRDHAITLGIMGKYASLRDAYASIDKAIEHASTHLSIDVDIRWLDTSDLTRETAAAQLGPEELDAMIVPGGFGDRGVEGKIACVELARTTGIPFLGICLGFQVAVIEYARHVLGLEGAHSTEFIATPVHPVISELPEQKKIEGLGGTMRLGAQDIDITPGTLTRRIYGEHAKIRERFRHRFEVEPEYIERLTAAGLIFSGRHPLHPIMQALELAPSAHPYFVAGQFHPELISRPLKPHPMFMGLLTAGVLHRKPDTDCSKFPARYQPAVGEGGRATGGACSVKTTPGARSIAASAR